MILKIFESFLNPDQSQVCMSNGLRARACQSEQYLFFSIEHKIEWGNVFTHSHAMSKQIQLDWPAMSQFKDLSQSKTSLLF